jgi:hypothetical protein
MSAQSHKESAAVGELPQNNCMKAEANALRVILKEDGKERPVITPVLARSAESSAHVLVLVDDVTPATVKLIRSAEYSVYRYTDGGVRLIREFKANA